MQACPVVETERPNDIEELVQRARRGDVDAFETIYRRHAGRIHAICRRLAGDAARAEELTQEAFLRAWSRLETYRPGTRFAAWLTRVAVNVAISDARSRTQRARRENLVDDPDAWDPPSPRPGPSSGLDLEAAIAALPPGARRVYVLHDVEGFRHDEIARELGLATGTTKAQLHRARKLLREALTRS